MASWGNPDQAIRYNMKSNPENTPCFVWFSGCMTPPW